MYNYRKKPVNFSLMVFFFLKTCNRLCLVGGESCNQIALTSSVKYQVCGRVGA